MTAGERWVVVALPGLELNAVASKTFRTREAAEKAAESLSRTAALAGSDNNGVIQVSRVESIATLRRLIKEATK